MLLQFFILLSLINPIQKNQLDGWDLLSTVEVYLSYDNFLGQNTEKPKFSSEILAKNGQKITLEGFVILTESNSNLNYFILSRFPYQSCFFCGAAGPETVVEIYTNKKVGYTDQQVRVTGRLQLNIDSPLHLFYILKESEVTVLE